MKHTQAIDEQSKPALSMFELHRGRPGLLKGRQHDDKKMLSGCSRLSTDELEVTTKRSEGRALSKRRFSLGDDPQQRFAALMCRLWVRQR
jgi:hypothetical protein